MKVRIDKADSVFSLYIRTRDNWTCQRCGSSFLPKSQGLQCSHYFGRGRENTRFDPFNADALCFGCHQIWGSEDREAYRDFKVRQLGGEGFELLRIRANTTVKKDRKAALLIATQLLKEVT